MQLPISRDHGFAILWGIDDMVAPAVELALGGPGPVTPVQLGEAITKDAARLGAPLRDAIAAVEQLDPGYAPLVAAARTNLDAWLGALAVLDDHTPLKRGGAVDWLLDRVNTGLVDVFALASTVAPVRPPTA